jgi:hypothetical protein
VPAKSRDRLRSLLTTGRINANHLQTASLKRLNPAEGGIWNLLTCWVTLGVGALMHTAKGARTAALQRQEETRT